MATNISIIVPCHNEVEHLESFTHTVMGLLKKQHALAEFIIVDNGSTDGSSKVLEKLEVRYPSIVVLGLPDANFGGALRKGLELARGDYLVIFNVDFYDERLILLSRVDLLGYDAIVCSKRLPASVDHRSISRRLMTSCYNWFLKLVFGFTGTDTTGIRVIRREKFLPIIPKCQLKSGVFDSALSIWGQKYGLKVLELPIQTWEVRPSRFPGSRLWQTAQDLWSLYRTTR